MSNASGSWLSLYSVQNDYYTLPYDFSQSPVYAFWSWTTVETKLWW